MGWATFDWDRAVVEVDSLLEARWRDGMLPHLHYDPRFVADYFPGPDWWPRATGHVANAETLTSGISNPPILPLAVRQIGERQPDAARRHEFWRRSLPALAAWLRWFLDARRAAGRTMPVVVHPWEAGWDNSPRWDALAAAGLRPTRSYRRLDTRHVGAAERPSGHDYDAYLGLAELLDGADYDLAAYLETTPFAVHDVLIDALVYGAAVDVNAMAAAVDEPPRFASEDLAAYARSFEAAHWDADHLSYFDRDALTGDLIRVQSAAAVSALAGGVISPDRAAAVWQAYARACEGAHLVCTVPPDAPQFESSRYWRGPVWLSVNWLVARGLGLAGLPREAELVRQDGFGLVERSGFFEYFDALSGEGRGIEGFTWTAALVLDWLES